MVNFHYISVLLDMMYGIEMEDQDVEELGLLAWERIGNKNTRMYRIKMCIDPTDNSITLPCNALDSNDNSCVELVTASWEDWERVTNKTWNGDFTTEVIETQIEAQKRYNSQWYLPGKVLKFDQVGDKLYFTRNYGMVNILYKGIEADEDGLPQLSEKEASAIATYIAYTQKFKEGMITNNGDILKMAEFLRQKWTQECDQARVTYLNQNDMNSILEIAYSWDRPRYGKSIKIIK